MNKTLFIIALLGIAFVSCKKQYTCECKYEGSISGTSSVLMEKMKKKDAEKKCDEGDETAADYTASCSIK